MRRLTGRSLLAERPGVGGALVWPDGDPDVPRSLAVLEETVREVFGACGLDASGAGLRPDGQGTSIAVAVPVPPDRLDPACDVLEEALWRAADLLEDLRPADLERRSRRLRERLEDARDPAWTELLAAAEARGLPVFSDDDGLTLGLGRGGRTWPLHALPSVHEVPWGELSGVPTILVTGTNGKTTTTRLIATILSAWGRRVGWTSTVGCGVGERTLEGGDWSGPGGARRVLRDPDVDVAVLETARGGLLRRGLALTGYAVGVLTNVADDHRGDFGVHDRQGMADVKALVGHGVAPDGVVVVNAEDPLLADRAFAARRVLFALDPRSVARHLADGGVAFTVQDGWIARLNGSDVRPIVPVADVPLAFGGRAPHNVANALAAAAACDAIGVPAEVVGAGLRSLVPTATTLPGRSTILRRGGTTVLLDFAHNAESVRQVLGLASGLDPAASLVVSVGMPGDRPDADLDAVGDVVADARPAAVIVRELEAVRRGRDRDEVPERLARRIEPVGADVLTAPDDRSSVALALAWIARQDGPHVLVVLAILDVPGVAADLTEAGFT